MVRIRAGAPVASPTVSSADPAATKRDVRVAWAIHALTASGVLLGAAGLEAVVRGHPRTAIVYLIAAMIVDGIDGPIARAARVQDALPGMDGNILDLVVDYLTCVMLPVAFMAYFHAFPSGWTVILCAAILFTAVLWFARTELMTPDHWFRGFPAIWNLVAPTFFLLHSAQWVNIVVTIGLCVLTLTDVKFVHPMQVRERRVVNIAVTTLWLAAMLAQTLLWPTEYLPLQILLIAAPAWFAFITVERTVRGQPHPVEME
jgi:phosphatidylcholine synthase